MRAMGQGLGSKRVGIALVFAVVLAGLVMVGHATTAPPDVAVSVVDFAFHGPNGNGSFTIPVGTKVTWTNSGFATHTTTSTAPIPDWNSGDLGHGASFSFTFTQAGTFAYKCLHHPGSMTGTITVVAPPNPTGVAPMSGTSGGGTNVTITGSGFQSGATVTFGGVSATGVNVVNANTITATTPAHASGAVDIVVTNPDTTAGTLASAFTFFPLPPPRPSVGPVMGARPIPAPRPPGVSNPTPPSPLPPTRPSGSGSGGALPVHGGGAPAPAPLPPRR